MYLHAGNDFLIKISDILGIFDIENTTAEGGYTRNLLDRAEKEHSCIYTSFEMPKSFIIVMKNNEEKVYISQLSASTLRKRILSEFGDISVT